MDPLSVAHLDAVHGQFGEHTGEGIARAIGDCYARIGAAQVAIRVDEATHTVFVTEEHTAGSEGAYAGYLPATRQATRRQIEGAERSLPVSGTREPLFPQRQVPTASDGPSGAVFLTFCPPTPPGLTNPSAHGKKDTACRKPAALMANPGCGAGSTPPLVASLPSQSSSGNGPDCERDCVCGQPPTPVS